MDKRPTDIAHDSQQSTPRTNDPLLDALNADLGKAVWLAAAEPWSLEDCLAQARAAQRTRSEEPTVVCQLARLSATAFIEHVGEAMPRPCARCATESTLEVCSTCHAVRTCASCGVCRGCCDGWLPDEAEAARD